MIIMTKVWDTVFDKRLMVTNIRVNDTNWDKFSTCFWWKNKRQKERWYRYSVSRPVTFHSKDPPRIFGWYRIFLKNFFPTPPRYRQGRGKMEYTYPYTTDLDVVVRMLRLPFRSLYRLGDFVVFIDGWRSEEEYTVFIWEENKMNIDVCKNDKPSHCSKGRSV